MNIFRLFRYFFEFYFFKTIFLFLNILPNKISTNIFCNFFFFFGKLSKYHSIAKQNCKIVFPELDENEIKIIIAKSWKNLGKNLYEINYLKKIINQKNLIEVKGMHILEKIKKLGSPVIFFSIHSSNWEICVPYLDHQGLKVGAIYRHINNKFFDKYIYQKRTNALKSKNSFYTPKGKISAKEIIEGVIQNKSIFLLVDQKDSAGNIVDFFGKKVKTQTGFLKIARKYNLKIVPIKNIRLPNNKFQITFQEPLEHNNKLIDDNIKMIEINNIIETWIKESPENWFWQHKRFN